MNLSKAARSISLDESRNTSKLNAQEVEVKELIEQQIVDMWLLFHAYYDDVEKNKFVSDLMEKDRVILLHDAKGQIQGFSTIKCFNKAIDGKQTRIVYSGDTIINQTYWGQTALQKAFYQFLFKEYLKHPFTPVYWFLISKGYKTYLLLSRNFKAYWPNYRKPTPEKEQQIIRFVAKEMFASAWREESGTLEFDQPLGKLKQAISPITDELLSHPEIKYFNDANPGHIDGNELCCLGHVNTSLVVSYPFKLLRKAVLRLKIFR
ncbi:MAG: hypothetical protein HWE27_03225 [Gammaproteobacteria bacterium]|nr:hypothetical protein [Gammaproteobacteria bacterium]